MGLCPRRLGHYPAVGGVVIPVNTFALLSPWLAVIGLVGCIGTIVVLARRRREWFTSLPSHFLIFAGHSDSPAIFTALFA